MSKKHALLVLAHKSLDYFFALARAMPALNIYIHVDQKSGDISNLYTKTNDSNSNDNHAYPPNIIMLSERIAVNWGGYSQIAATLRLFQYAYSNPDNYYFHLMSGEDVLLQSCETITREWEAQHDAMMMTAAVVPQYGYRFRFDTLHADKSWQRQLAGKLLTKLYQGTTKLSPYTKTVYFGSQWFSVTRQDWQQILPHIYEYEQFFQYKLVPDEHFFQTLTHEATNIRVSNDNKRLIIFDKNINNGNSPIYLTDRQLQQAQQAGYWFARKAMTDQAINFLTHQFVPPNK